MYLKVITIVIVETGHIIVINCVKKTCNCVDEIIPFIILRIMLDANIVQMTVIIPRLISTPIFDYEITYPTLTIIMTDDVVTMLVV